MWASGRKRGWSSGESAARAVADSSRRLVWLFDGTVVMNDHLNWDDHRDSGTNDHGIITARLRCRPIQAEMRALAVAGPTG